MNNNIQKYQWGNVLKWLGTSLDDGVRFVRKPFVARHYAKMGVDVTAPQNAKMINALSRRSPIKISYDPVILKERLIAEGINPLLLSEKNLQHLIGLRQYDILQGVVPDRFALRTSVPTLSGPLYGYDLFRKTRSVGGITAHETADGINTVVVQNLTKGTPNYVKGVSEQGYNAVIGDIGHIISGRLYQSPHISTKVMDKFHNKTFLGNIGRHDWSDSGGLIELGPVWKLNEPTYNVPVKYLDIFNFEGLSPQGKFMIDFNKGPMYKNGGKIKNPQQ